MSVPVRIAAPTALVLALLLALSACSATRTTGEGGSDRRPATSGHPVAGKADAASGVVLNAERTTPTDIDLRWRGGGSGVSGHVLEFATEESGPYTVLQYLPPQVTSYRHPDLIPNTTFFYRLRVFRGPVSKPVSVTLPKGELTAADENSGHEWLPARKDPKRTVPGRPLRSGGAGAPTGLKAAVKHANGILFTWTDRASDEAGFLLESRTRTGSAYEPVVVLDPDVNSTGLITLPTEKEASYRVRAFTYGERSNVVRLTTGGSTGP
ncbi:fibronectin type III domain-containing protein [Streptomyces phaeochromogenes]|uniref:fibronectin type III domain-containing protein n=1 Tax=Streptomyces phaeochromogenes TaxID=1923 RepID=UPI002DDA3F11|nr:fibronectin type III domain-containing protein [Streptomyces phaeochromogenes]WRZ27187.1 fibronectin type III domain-containing protein [Streptomyces phaeochromogenes]